MMQADEGGDTGQTGNGTTVICYSFGGALNAKPHAQAVVPSPCRVLPMQRSVYSVAGEPR